jgi:tetratricopeptide (TPR) repeat protein
MELKSALDELAAERRWGDLLARVAELDDSELTGDPKVAYLVAEALLHVGRELGDLKGAEERFSEQLELARETGNEEMSGRATNNLGAIASLRGENGRALSLFRLSIPAYQKVGFLQGLAQTDHNLGIVHRDLGYWREAERHYRSAQRHARQLGDERLAAMARVGQAEIAFRRGDDRFAAIEARRSLQIFVQLGDELGRADALRLLGSIAASRSKLEEGRRYLEEALALARQYSNPLLEAEVLEERADVHVRAGRFALARADLEAAAINYRRLGADKRQKSAEERLEHVTL